MKKISNLLTLSFFLALFAAGQAQEFKNLNYITLGYDIYLGNPHTPQIDPGFKNQVFDLQKMEDSLVLLRTDGCSLEYETTELDSMASYEQSLEVEVSVHGGFEGIAAFKASTAYKSMEKSISTSSDKYFYSTAVCDVYRAKMSEYNPLHLHPTFIIALKTLPTDYDEKAYFKLLKNYGTHAVLDIQMGARYDMISSISEQNLESLKSQGITVGVAVSASAFGASGGVDTRTSTQKEWANKYKNSVASWRIISVGAKPVANGDGVAWAQQVISEPMPLRYTLTPLTELLTPEYVRGALNSSHMNSLRENLEKALSTYCENNFKSKGSIASCERASATKPKPKIGSCRWCANKCGGDFPSDGGQLVADPNRKKRYDTWAFTFAPGCMGSYQQNQISTGAHLCCPEVEPKRGQCRLCRSCGGEFPEGVGVTFADGPADNFGVAFDDNCLSLARSRDHPGDGMKLCCQQNPVCSLCSSCGGQWPYENGVLAYGESWYRWFRGRGKACSGSIQRQYDIGRSGMKWCCKTL